MRTKGAVKPHLLLDHDGYLPGFAVTTEGKVHEVNVAKTLAFPARTVVIYDCGYNDYRLSLASGPKRACISSPASRTTPNTSSPRNASRPNTVAS